MSGRLEGKVAIVTGAGQGIGEAIARAFAREGARVVIAEINAQTGSRLAAELTDALFIQTDVTDAASVEAMIAQTVERYGQLDALVNNAGVNAFYDPLKMTDDQWQRCFAVDLDGVWRCSRAALPALLERGAQTRDATIINIASVHSFSIIPSCFPYPVAKHGLIGLTKALALEYAARGLRVNAIAPGYIETRLSEEYWQSFIDPSAERARVYNLHPPKRIGYPEEVAMTAVFLASNEATFINAATITIDGGRSVLYHD